MRRLLALAGLLVVLGILAGCGGSGGRVGDTLEPGQEVQLAEAADMDGEYYADVDFYRTDVINNSLLGERSSRAREAMNAKTSRAARDVPGGTWSGPDAAGWYTYTATGFVAKIRYFAATREVEYTAEYYDTLFEIGHEVYARYFLNGDPFGGAPVYPTHGTVEWTMAMTDDTTGDTVSLALRCEMDNLLKVSLIYPPALYPQVVQGEFDYYLTMEVNGTTAPTLDNFQFHHIATTVNGADTVTPTLVVDGWFDSPTAPQVDYDTIINLY